MNKNQMTSQRNEIGGTANEMPTKKPHYPKHTKLTSTSNNLYPSLIASCAALTLAICNS